MRQIMQRMLTNVRTGGGREDPDKAGHPLYWCVVKRKRVLLLVITGGPRLGPAPSNASVIKDRAAFHRGTQGKPKSNWS